MADNSEEAPKPEEESRESSGENAPPAENVVAGEEEPPPEQPEEPENVENVEKPEIAEDAEVEVEPSKVADEVESPAVAAAAEAEVAATEEEAKPDAGEEGVEGEGEGTGEPTADEVIRVHEEKEEDPKEVEAGEETGHVESERQDDEEQIQPGKEGEGTVNEENSGDKIEEDGQDEPPKEKAEDDAGADETVEELKEPEDNKVNEEVPAETPGDENAETVAKVHDEEDDASSQEGEENLDNDRESMANKMLGEADSNHIEDEYITDQIPSDRVPEFQKPGTETIPEGGQDVETEGKIKPDDTIVAPVGPNAQELSEMRTEQETVQNEGTMGTEGEGQKTSQPTSRAGGHSSDAHLSTTTEGPSTEPPPAGQVKKEQPEKKRGSSANSKPTAKQLNHCLNLDWCFGVNKYCPALNMLYKLNADDPGRDSVLYTCSNIAVLYDFNENTQTLLQGHSHAITCTVTSEDKRWLVTADSGKFASIIIWDTFTFIPVQTIFDPHPSADGSGDDTGVAAIAMTNDAKYIASVSSSTPQSVSIWDWTSRSGVSATASVTLSLHDTHVQTFIKFNPANPFQLVSNSQDQVVFYLWDGAENLNYHDPKVTDKDFNRFVGTFSQSIHAPGSKWTFTATSAGNVVVWAPDKALDRQAASTPSALYKLKAFKLVKLQERALTVLTTHDQYVVTGDIAGCIKFYDNQLRMINWYQDFDRIGPINSVSFAYCPGFPFTVARNNKMPTDATIEANKFPIKDFIISTITAKVGKVQNDGTELVMISQEHDEAIYALAAHPKRSHICMGSFAGYIKVWDYEKKKVVCDLKLKPKQLVTCLTYDPSGTFIAFGFDDGNVRVMDSLTLADELKQPFAMSQKSITHIKFSHNSKYLVTADKDLCVVVYKAQFSEGSAPFVFFGKNRAHYKEITEIMFGVALENEFPRLMSIGRDRVLVEYDLENSSEDDIRIASTNKIEQSGVPLSLAWYPPVMKEDFLITANDQFKLKLFNSTTKMCRKTVLGPTYGTPLTKLAVLPHIEDPFKEPRYIAFATKDRIGLHKLPVNGNPHDAMVTVAHPQGIADICCSHDSKFIFTAGGVDCTVQMWQVHFPAIEACSKLGGEDLVPFYDLMQGGREGQLFKELEDYFYYAMVRSQGVNTMKKRHVSVTIPISEIPFVMRALGFYPTEQEIEDMLNEIKFSKYVETGNYVTDIDLNTFIKLYVNHRPAFGLNPHLIAESFEHLGVMDQKGHYIIDRDDFIEILQNRGEQLNDSELAELISVLLGISPEGSVSEIKEFKAIEQDPDLLDRLPVEISADLFSTTLLGFPVSSIMTNTSVEESDKGSKLTPQASAKSVRLVTTGTQAE